MQRQRVCEIFTSPTSVRKERFRRNGASKSPVAFHMRHFPAILAHVKYEMIDADVNAQRSDQPQGPTLRMETICVLCVVPARQDVFVVSAACVPKDDPSSRVSSFFTFMMNPRHPQGGNLRQTTSRQPATHPLCW